MRPLPQKHQCADCGSMHYSAASLTALNDHFRTCAECGEPLFYAYCLKDDVWAATGYEYHGGTLHLPCVERLIGRKLTLDDFNFQILKQGHSINDAIKWAALNQPKFVSPDYELSKYKKKDTTDV